MEAFKIHRGLIAPLDRANVDTDQIIPKQFLKSVQRTGFEKGLFFDWRYLTDGTPNPDFTLNAEKFKGASVLVTGNNFGCGSSREHAVWAIRQFGFRVLIAPFYAAEKIWIPAFADIFKNNCSKNSVLTVELKEEEVRSILSAIEQNSGLEMTADLENQKLILHLPQEKIFTFEIEPAEKERMMNGLDDIGVTLQHQQEIQEYEKNRAGSIEDRV